MSAKDPTPLLDIARNQYANQKLIGLLGLAKSGKTVVAALLHHAIVNRFLPDHPQYRFRINDGIEFLKQSSLSLKKGEFPEKTPESEINNVDMELAQEVASGGSIVLKLYDIAGEVYEKLFDQEYSDNELLFLTLSHEKGKNPIGTTSFLPFCKMYALLIDCGKFEEWNRLSFENMKILNAIFKWKKRINQSQTNKLNIPIAILLTKSDLLSEEDRNSSVEDLLKKHMAEFYHQLKSIFGDKIEFFKMFVDIERDENNKPKIVPVQPGSLIETKNKSNPETESTAESTSSSTTMKPAPVPKYLVKRPLTYSEDEYVKFISWVDSAIKD